MDPLSRCLPHYFMGGMLACCLHFHKTKGPFANAGQGTKMSKDVRCLTQFLSLCILSLCCLWIYTILFRYDTIAYYTSHSNIFLFLSQLVTSFAISFTLFSVLISKSHPSFNHYLFSLFSSLSSFCSSFSAFPTYLYLSHFLICFECLFLFDHNMGHTYHECAIVVAYVIFLTCICHAVLKELILLPSQRAFEALGNRSRKMFGLLSNESKLTVIEASTGKPKESSE